LIHRATDGLIFSHVLIDGFRARYDLAVVIIERQRPQAARQIRTRGSQSPGWRTQSTRQPQLRTLAEIAARSTSQSEGPLCVRANSRTPRASSTSRPSERRGWHHPNGISGHRQAARAADGVPVGAPDSYSSRCSSTSLTPRSRTSTVYFLALAIPHPLRGSASTIPVAVQLLTYIIA
jgi:hypothetical protein